MSALRIASAFVLLLWCGLLGPETRAQSPVLHGRVVAADTGSPLRHARVQPAPTSQTASPAFTDAEGRFELALAVDDSSSLLVTKPGYLPMSVAPPGAGREAEVRLSKAGAISGRIVDSLGDPVIGMTVTAELSVATESARKVVATAQTDDLGEYRLSGLPEGRFFVSLDAVAAVIGEDGRVVENQQLAATLSSRRARTTNQQTPMRVRAYYGGQSIGDAQPVALGPGEERAAIDFSSPALRPVATSDGVGSRVIPRVGTPGNTGVARGRVTTTDGRPLTQAIVRLDFDAPGGNAFPAAVTDAAGRYEFQGLGERLYTITATRAGFLTSAYGQRRPSDGAAPVPLQSNERRDNVDIALSRPSAITGRVVDDAGEPVEAAEVQVLRIQYRDGRRLVGAGGQGTHRTDDRGVYRIYGLEPDEYIVGASVGRVVPGLPIVDLRGFSTTYAPETSNPGAARRIAVDLAQDALGVDIALVRAPTARISGTIVDSLNRPVAEGLILTPRRRSVALSGDPIQAWLDPEGRFEFRNVTPGEYVVQASLGADNASNEGEWAAQFVTVGNADIAGLNIRLLRGSTLKGHISLEGQAAAETYFGLNLQAMPVDRDLTPQTLETPASAQIQPDGAFDMTGLSGPRVIRLNGAVGDWTLKGVFLDGQDVTDVPLLFGTPTQSIDRLEVVLTDRISVVRGRVLDARGRPVANAIVVVFSTDRSAWGEPSRWGETSRFVGSVSAGKDGAFTLRNLAPGDYWAAALTQARSGEWRDPVVLEALVPTAAHVAMSEGETVTAELRVVPR